MPAACFFASDLHGHRDRYEKLLAAARAERPRALFLGGDLLPHRMADGGFLESWLAPRFLDLGARLGEKAPRVFLIPGNDDPRAEEPGFRAGEDAGAWEYLPSRKTRWGPYTVYGYPFVPPTPFRLKDWERYDVSRYVDPGSLTPEEGWHSVEVPDRERRLRTIASDLDVLADRDDLSRAIFLFHTPPYRTLLDRAALEAQEVDHAPLDVHVGSIAVRRFLESRQPLVALHGHVHESARITGSFRDRIGRTVCLSAAHDGPELALVRFDPEAPETATRELL